MNSPIDFKIAERVWDNISANTDRELADKKYYVEREFFKLKETLGQFSAAIPRNKAEQMQKQFDLSLNVTHFVSRALMFYALIKRDREFNEQEKTLGKDLLLLHEQVSAMFGEIQSEMQLG